MRYAILAATMLTGAALMAPAAAAPGKPAAPPAWRHACGRIVNYGPANWSFIDRFGSWDLGIQGGHQARGLDDIPDLSIRDWKDEGPSSGEGCVCLDVQPEARGKRIAALRFVRQLPLKTCRADPALKIK